MGAFPIDRQENAKAAPEHGTPHVSMTAQAAPIILVGRENVPSVLYPFSTRLPAAVENV